MKVFNRRIVRIKNASKSVTNVPKDSAISNALFFPDNAEFNRGEARKHAKRLTHGPANSIFPFSQDELSGHLLDNLRCYHYSVLSEVLPNGYSVR